MQILCDHEVAPSHDLRFYRETRWSALFCGLLLLAFVAAVFTFLTIAQSWESPWALGGFAGWCAVMALPIHICLRTSSSPGRGSMPSRRPASSAATIWRTRKGWSKAWWKTEPQGRPRSPSISRGFMAVKTTSEISTSTAMVR